MACHSTNHEAKDFGNKVTREIILGAITKCKLTSDNILHILYPESTSTFKKQIVGVLL